MAGRTNVRKSGKICMFNSEFLSYPLVNNWYLESDRLCLVHITKRTKNDRSVSHSFKALHGRISDSMRS